MQSFSTMTVKPALHHKTMNSPLFFRVWKHLWFTCFKIKIVVIYLWSSHWTFQVKTSPHKATHTIPDLSFTQQEMIPFYLERRRKFIWWARKVTCLTIIHYLIPISFHFILFFCCCFLQFKTIHFTSVCFVLKIKFQSTNFFGLYKSLWLIKNLSL